MKTDKTLHIIFLGMILILSIGVYSLMDRIEKQEKLTESIVFEYEKFINQISNLDNFDHTTTNTIPWTVTIGDFKFTNDSIEYMGDSVIVVNIDSIQSLYSYYRIRLEPSTSEKIKLMTVCYGNYFDWKKREINGITQYSFDGINWFEI